MSSKKTFLIYDDQGVSKLGVQQWFLRSKTWNCKAKIINSDYIIYGKLKSSDILIIPGGADVYYCSKLSGRGIVNIKQFINNGGIYIGSCAGAYFAHSHINWNNQGETIIGKRDLSLFKGEARGPLKFYNPDTYEGIAYVEVFIVGQEKKKAIVYYNGGPIMAIDDSTELIAKFTYNKKNYPAVMSKVIGKGLAIAMSLHMEYSYEYLNSIKAPQCHNREDMFFDIFNPLIFNDYREIKT